MPPAGNRWPLPTLEISTDRQLSRLTRVRHEDPAYFGRAAAFRFDAPDGSFGVCYFGTTLDCCFLEIFSAGRDPHTQRLFITTEQLSGYYASSARLTRPIRVAYLADDGLAHLAIDQRVTGGDDYDLSQRWARAIHDHGSGIDGIFYATRHHNGL